MTQSQAEIQKALGALLEIIEGDHADTAESATNKEQRKEERRKLRVACEVCLFHGIGMQRTLVNASARNITFSGISLVLNLREPVGRDRPIEVIASMGDGKRTHLAGVVAFCRELDLGVFEVGVEVKASGASAILMHDLTTAQVTYEWFAAALLAPE